jgi:hypothetical protein
LNIASGVVVVQSVGWGFDTRSAVVEVIDITNQTFVFVVQKETI